jgi:hypothetical protein
MKVTLYCGTGDGDFWVAATELSEMGLHTGRIPAVGELVMPAGEARWYRVVSVGWQLGADPVVEVVAVHDPHYEPHRITVVPPPRR